MTTETTPKGTFAIHGFLCQDLLRIIDLIPNKGVWAAQKIRLGAAISPLYESFNKAHAEVLNELCDKDAEGKPVKAVNPDGTEIMKFSTAEQQNALGEAIQKLVTELPISVDVSTNAPIKAALTTLRNILTSEQCPEIPADKFASFAAILSALDTALDA